MNRLMLATLILVGCDLVYRAGPTPDVVSEDDSYDGGSNDAGTDGDADTDADSDVDTDSDTDGDSDADSDADSDSDSDGDGDGDGDADSDTDSDSDSDSGTGEEPIVCDFSECVYPACIPHTCDATLCPDEPPIDDWGSVCGPEVACELPLYYVSPTIDVQILLPALEEVDCTDMYCGFYGIQAQPQISGLINTPTSARIWVEGPGRAVLWDVGPACGAQWDQSTCGIVVGGSDGGWRIVAEAGVGPAWLHIDANDFMDNPDYEFEPCD